MAETFNIVITGELVAGAAPEQVRANLAKLFKTDAARVGRLLSSKRVVIKKGLDEAAARKYQAILGKAGVIAEMVQERTVREPRPAAPPAAPDLSVAPPGAQLVDPQPVKTPDIDTGHLSLAAVGATLVESTPVSAPQFDLSAMQLDPPGTPLAEPPDVPPADYDTSTLSLKDN